MEKFLNFALNFPNLAAIEETFTFNPDDNTFKDGFEFLTGSWRQTGRTTFAVDVNVEALLSLLPEGIIAEENPSSFFTGSVQQNGKIKGKFNLTLGISGSFSGGGSSGMVLDGSSLILSGNFVGLPLSMSKSSDKSVLRNQSKAFVRTIIEGIFGVVPRVRR